MSKHEKENPITWFQYNNIAGILASAMMIAAAFWGVSTKVEVLIERVSTLIKVEEQTLFKISELEKKTDDLDRRITRIEARIGNQ